MTAPQNHFLFCLIHMKKKTSILVGICSALGYEERRKAQRETWLQYPQEGVECLFFVGGGIPVGEDDCIALDAPDTYHELPQKILAFFQYALKHYDFDWLFKCDDDTYVALDRLKKLPDGRFSLIGDISLEKRQAPSGGAGYMLSRALVEKIVATPDIPEYGAEDLIYGKVALDLGVPFCATDKLCMHNRLFPTPDNEMITSHWCSPEQIRAIDLFYRGEPDIFCLGGHPDWEDDLLFYKKGFFRRQSTGCSGTWHLDDSGALCLTWFAGAREQLVFIGNQYVGTKLRVVPPAPRFVPNALVELLQERKQEDLPVRPPLYLHLGCGSNYLKGWVNLDMPNFDITKPLPFDNNSVESIFLEHVIEHVLPAQAYDFFLEAKRVLKPRGVLRLSFPDILRIAEKTTSEYREFVHHYGWGDGKPGCEIHAIIANHGHQSIWTADTMIVVLRAVGFEASQVIPGESEHSHLRELEHHGNMIGESINLIETSSVEALKV